MFNQIKPGYILRFGTCPSTIRSPSGGNADLNDPALVTPWLGASNLGVVQCLSHPSGALAVMAADVATQLRPGRSISRSASYSKPGRDATAADRPIGTEVCDFVGYTDGKSLFINSLRTVFSKDFSGCLFVSYSVHGQRRVAHVAASQVPNMNCKQPFLNTIQAQGAVLHGWCRPFQDVVDGARRMTAFNLISKYVGGNPYAITTFGVLTQTNQAYSIDAFKPVGGHGNDWVVTHVAAQVLSPSWVAP